MNVLIQNYRGFDITFDTEKEKFTFCIDTIGHFDKQGYSACTQKIDEFIKENSKFEPFTVMSFGNPFNDARRLKIIAIRKDGRFVYEENGKKEQVSEWNEKEYILDVPENEIHLVNIAALQVQISDFQDKIKEEYAKIKAPTLAQLKRKYMPPQ